MVSLIPDFIVSVAFICVLGIGGGFEDGFETFDMSEPPICRGSVFRFGDFVNIPWWAERYVVGIGVEVGPRTIKD